VTSLRRRLFLLLLAATGAIWLCATVWIYVSSRAELEHVLDTRLQEAARMVHSLVASGNMTAAVLAPAFQGPGYERQLSCQIWSLDGRLVARSSGAPDQSLAAGGEGFADRQVNGEGWRVYTIVDAGKGVRVAVGDRLGLRDRLVYDLVSGLIWPAVLIVPLLGILIWLSLGRGLRPLKIMAGQIAAREGEDMRPIASEGAPSEIQPLLAALNGLFGKVETARRHERDITAFAAHELRTPLAGLKTQAQVALAATDGAVRQAALRQILVSVDRTARLARQLLALAKLEAMPDPVAAAAVPLGAVLRDVVQGSPTPAGIAVEIDPDLAAFVLKGEAETVFLVLRNLHENAVQHARSRIAWRALPDGRGLAVEDDGPGVAEDELAFVTTRFFRGRHKSAAGTGLGLTIAEMAARRQGATLAFANLADGRGFCVTVAWPAS